MKKTLIAISSLAIALSFGSCKPKQSTYRKVYEQAKQREIAHQNTNNNDNVIISKPASEGIAIRRERLNPVEGENKSLLKNYSVVIGSFQNRTNAVSLKERMESAGFTPVLAENEYGMIRVIVSSFTNKAAAIASRENIKERFAPLFQDAWLLELAR